MSFISNMLNGIPVVGHVKGVVHYVTGDSEAGNRAMCESTRSSLVMGGGVVGLIGGPAGAVAGAMAAGALTDCVTSVVTGTPQGVIESVGDIQTDICNGNVPVGPVLRMGLLAGSDAISGLGAGAFTGATTSAAKSVGQQSVKIIVASEAITVGNVFRSAATTDEVEQSLKPKPSIVGIAGIVAAAAAPKPESSDSDEPSAQSTTHGSSSQTTTKGNDSKSKNSASTARSGAGQPPRDNDNDKNKPTEHSAKSQSESDMTIFLRIFNVQSLDDVTMGQPGINIFKGLEDHQKRTLEKKIKNLRKTFYFEEVINIIILIFKSLDTEDVTFLNFLSLVNFVATYIGEHVAQHVESTRIGTPRERRQQPLNNALTSNLGILAQRILDYFTSLRGEIAAYNERVTPCFRDIFSAAYHWYKHGLTPTGSIFSIPNYFHLIKRLLEKLKALPQYSELTNVNHPRRQIVYEIFCPILRRRIRIVVKVQDGHLELSSCYEVESIFKGDEDHDEFIGGKKEDCER